MSVQVEQPPKRSGDDLSKEEKRALKKTKKEEEKKKKKHHHQKEEKDKHHKHKKEKKSKKHHDLHEDSSEQELKKKEPSHKKDFSNGDKTAKITSTPEQKNEPDAALAEKFLKENEISVTDPLKSKKSPILSFKELPSYGVDPKIAHFFNKFEKPTPIQSATWPYLLDRRDIVGIAETGSGKTFAFAVPAINHILQTLGGKKTKGIKVLAVSPTRELALQINDNIQELVTSLGLHSVCVYGGVSKDVQIRAVKNADIVVATPGRLNDLLSDGSCNLSKVSYLILDEADRMLETGFEEDIKSIISYCPAENRQTVMFTATWPQSVRELAKNYQKDAVKVTVGENDDLRANSRVEQIVEVIDPRSKSQKLYQILKDYNTSIKKGERILIFALYKKEASRVESDLRYRGYNVAAIHGDLSQDQRTKALEAFKSGTCPLMLATDVAARGLDIPSVKLVINLTFPLTVEDYVHRIGRTGRAGQTGKSITLFTEHEKHLSGALINVLRAANQPVPEELLKFGGHTKKKEHSVYGAFFKEAASDKPAPKKIKFDT